MTNEYRQQRVKNNKIKYIASCLLALLFTAPIITAQDKAPYKRPSNEEIARLLGWINTPASPCSLCGGYFFEPKNIREHPTPPPYKKLPTKVTAKGPTIFSKTGESILQKDVRVTQPGRLTQADKAYIYRNKKTGQITHIKLVGHVHMQEHDKLVVSDKATLHLKNNTAQLNHFAYRITQKNLRMGKYNAWGTGKQGNRLANGVITVEHGTFSTCSPLHPTWELRAKHIKLDPNKKKGVARNATLRLGPVPVLYTPYISFSMNNVRKSGILAPLIQNSTKNGFTVSLPYYWNMAPNYDMTITPVYYSLRNFQLTTLFRFITENSVGNLYAAYLPSDPEFQRFKNNTFNQFPPPINPIFQPYIDQLRETSDGRGYFAFNNHTQFSDRWTANTQLNYVTDPYYLRDFGATINDVIANQLLNQFDIHYTGLHWNMTLLSQVYQTLHLIDQSSNPTVNQYMRLPELDTSAIYPKLFGNVDFTATMQAINFDYHSLFPPVTDAQPIGQRLHIRPTFSQSIDWAYGYLTPSFTFDSTSYNVVRPQPPQVGTSSRNIPITDIDSGLYFDRQFDLHHHEYIQTFEPRLFYLYVPFQNQDRYPVYDTQILPFTFAQLFALNRFTGFDRIQNANQISLGITSRILDSDNASQILNFSSGVGYLIDKPKVCLSPGCNLESESWTPLTTQITFYPTKHWSISSNFAWDPELSQMNNAQFNLNYSRDRRHIIGGSYTFVHAQPGSPNYSTTGYSGDSALYSFYFAWPINAHLSTLGYLFYNGTSRHFEDYFGGIQYNTCCISFRFIVDRSFLGTQPIAAGTRTRNLYSTNYIFQIQFKGIGSAGNSNPYAMLESAIPGYLDPFKY